MAVALENLEWTWKFFILKGYFPKVSNFVEAATRFELVNSGFADRCLTTWLCRPKKMDQEMERETGFEPATSTLARSHSTAELFPLRFMDILQNYPFCQQKIRLNFKMLFKLYKIINA